MYRSTKNALEKVRVNQWILNTLKANGGKEVATNALFELEEKIAEYKREYRARLREETRPEYFRGTNGIIVNCGGEYDHFWIKVFFEGQHWTEEEKADFRDMIWIRAPYSPYDCTGALFTWAVDSFNTPRGVVAFVREALDI